MKPDIHPKYHKITVKLPKGGSFETYSSYHGTELLADVDFRVHPAWTGKGLSGADQSSKAADEFGKKYGGLSFLKTKK